jgi:hypothetical protein
MVQKYQDKKTMMLRNRRELSPPVFGGFFY